MKVIVKEIKLDDSTESYILNIEPSETVLQLKAKITQKTGIPPQDQFLSFGTLELQDPKCLSFYNIENDSVVELMRF